MPRIPFKGAPQKTPATDPPAEPGPVEQILALVQELKGGLDSLHNRVASIEKITTNPPREPRREEYPPDVTLEDIQENPLEAGRRLVREEAGRLMAGPTTITVMNAIRSAEDRLRADPKWNWAWDHVKEAYEHQKSEIMQRDPTALAIVFPNGDTGVDRAYRFALGNSMPEILEKLKQVKPAPSAPPPRRVAPPRVEPGGARTPTPAPDGESPGAGGEADLTPRELTVAKQFRMTPQQYAAARDRSDLLFTHPEAAEEEVPGG